MRYRKLFVIAVVTVVVAALLTGWFTLVEPIRVHRDWDKRVQQDIRALAGKRPQEVPKGQWEFMVGWTWQMHGNCGSIHGLVEPGWREGFAAELERRLAGPMTAADIDWIWDEYAAHTKGGQS